MIGIIILISLLICALCLLIALLYIRQTEIEVKDKSVDLWKVLSYLFLKDRRRLLCSLR